VQQQNGQYLCSRPIYGRTHQTPREEGERERERERKKEREEKRDAIAAEMLSQHNYWFQYHVFT
jgi:hypothetical protein